MKLRRKISQHQGGDPAKMSVMSQGAIFYALDDAKHDILALHAQNAELLAALELIQANAAESPEWIRMRIQPVIARAGGVK